MLQRRFARHFLLRFGELRGRRVLVALSGGSDSVALLHLLRGSAAGLDLHVAHVHHGVRGAEADADAVFCRELATVLGHPFHERRLAPPPSPELGREASWRRLRYRALLELKGELVAAAVATGHQRDDIAEGVLVQLLRGGGPRALSGIGEWTPDDVVRPLLPWTRAELREWLRDHGHPWREDASNLDRGHLRNRVRHDILPDLERVAPSLRRHLTALADDLAQTEDLTARILGRDAPWIHPYAPAGGVPMGAIKRLHPALRSRWLHAQAARAGLHRATRRQVEQLHQMLEHGSPRAVTLSERWTLRRFRGRLWLEPPQPAPEYRVELAPGVRSELPIPGWSVSTIAGGPPSDPWRSPPLPEEALHVRSPRAGDRFAGKRLVDHLGHVPRHLRRAWPVVCSGVTIVWVPGVSGSYEADGRVTVEVQHP